MSSITKATARPVSTIWKASGWPLAEMMFMPRFCAALISVICLMLVVPAVETMVLPFRSSSCLMFRRLLRDPAVGGDEVRDREPDLLLARDVVGGRAALQVDGAVRHQRDAVGRGDQLVVDLDRRHLQLGFDRVDDPVAQVHRVADRLLLVVVVGEGDRGVAVADGDASRCP